MWVAVVCNEAMEIFNGHGLIHIPARTGTFARVMTDPAANAG